MIKKKLTDYSLSGGCGCKIDPGILKKLLQPIQKKFTKKSKVRIDFSKSDDAAVFEMNENQNIVCTTDFFVPIVDNPEHFGQIAATNAISDVYAMGAKPLFALSILGIPKNNFKINEIKKILRGASIKCEEANINILGGHTIEINEPIFGLVVVGESLMKETITNSNAKHNDQIILTKPLGIGIYSSAFKQRKLSRNCYKELINITTLLNRPGYEIPKLLPISAMTDVTGFGLLGHLMEICSASNVEANIYLSKIPKLRNVEKLINDNIITSASKKNFKHLRKEIYFQSKKSKLIKTLLCDPQTSGGLLICIKRKHSNQLIDLLIKSGFSHSSIIGEIKRNNKCKITIL